VVLGSFGTGLFWGALRGRLCCSRAAWVGRAPGARRILGRRERGPLVREERMRSSEGIGSPATSVQQGLEAGWEERFVFKEIGGVIGFGSRVGSEWERKEQRERRGRVRGWPGAAIFVAWGAGGWKRWRIVSRWRRNRLTAMSARTPLCSQLPEGRRLVRKARVGSAMQFSRHIGRTA
jgi:hypothetical protein